MYDTYSDLIECKSGDKVYVYSGMLDTNISIDESMIGTVEKIEQRQWEDMFGSNYLEYYVKIKMKDGNTLKIKDPSRQLIRKHEFITMKELDKIKNNSLDK